MGLSMRLIDRLVDLANRYPATVYRVQSLISKDRAVQREIFSELLETAGVLGRGIPRVLDIASGTGHFAQIHGPQVPLILSDLAIENCFTLPVGGSVPQWHWTRAAFRSRTVYLML